jgi:hypothetical protein
MALSVGCYLLTGFGLYFLALLLCVVGDTPAITFFVSPSMVATVHLLLGTDR